MASFALFSHKKSEYIAKFTCLVIFIIFVLLLDKKTYIFIGLKDYIQNIFITFQVKINEFPENIKNILLDSINYDALVKQNKYLANELAIAKMQINKNYSISNEYEQLQEILQLKQTIKITTIPSKILYFSQNSSNKNTAIIEGGENKNIKINQIIISPLGLVGKISKVYVNYSEITLITSPNLLIPVQNLAGDVQAIASSNSSNNYYSSLNINYVAPNNNLKNGDILVTSGLDEIYPQGLIVGKITKISMQKNQDFLSIQASLNNITNMRYVLILSSNK